MFGLRKLTLMQSMNFNGILNTAIDPNFNNNNMTTWTRTIYTQIIIIIKEGFISAHNRMPLSAEQASMKHHKKKQKQNTILKKKLQKP